MANDKKFIAKNGIQGLDASVFTSITTSGSVGVGTASPVAGLDVLGTSGYTGTIHNHAYASGEGARIFGDEATLDLLGKDSGDHSSSVYFRNGTEGFAWINDPGSDSFQLRSFTSTGNDFSAHGTGAAVSNLVSILDISKTGNVGIGTDAPGEKLDVNGDVRVRSSGGTIGGANIANSALLVGSTTTGIGIDSNEIYSKGDPLYIGVLDAEDIIFRYGTIKLVTIQSGGNVGIGTDTPAKKLHVHSGNSSDIARFANDSGSFTLGKTANLGSLDMAADANFRIRHGSTLSATFKSDGNVGINTTSPNTLLTVLSKGAISGDDTRVLELKNNGTAFNADALTSYNANTSYDVANGATLTYHSRGTAAGNIMAHVAGVNTEPVLSDRIVRAASQSTGTAMYNRTYFAWDGAGSAAADMNVASTQLLETISATGQTGSRYSLYGNGDVYYAGTLTLGQTDVASAHINSYEVMTFNIDTDNDDTNRYFSWQTDGASGSGTKLMTLTDEGNLGIGTTDPGYKLDVVGNLRLQSATDVILDLNADTGNNSGEAYHPEVRFWQDGGVNSNLMLAIGSDNVGGAYTGTLANSAFIMGGDGHSGNIPLHFGVNNTVYATMASTGNLGIGITNPQDPLVVKSSGTMGGAATNANSFFTITDGSYSMYHDPNELVSDIAGSFHIAANNAAGELQFQTGGTTARMQIKSDGKVGIGTVTPSNVLHVHGSDSGITVSADASDRPHIRLVNGTAEMLRLSANNLYGAIGDSSDSQRYMVFKNDFIGTNTQTAPNAQIHIGTATAEGTATNPALQIGGANTYRLGFYTEAELGIIDAANGDNGLAIHTKTIGEAVRINAAGQVGIGTNIPFSKLNVHGDNNRLAFGAVTSNLAAQHRIEFWETPASASVTDSNYAIEYDGTATHGGDGALLFRGYGSAANQMYAGINRQGTTFLGMEGAVPRVGIGTTNPTNKLDIRGNVTQIDGSPEYHFATSSATHYNWRIAAQEAVDQGFEIASGTQVAGTSANSDTYTNRLVIKATGNVGIGTNSPGSKLEVYNNATAGNTQLHIHNDKTGDAAVIRLEGGRTASNDATQINFANTGKIGSAIRMYSSGSDEGDMRFYTSTTSTGDATQERMRIESGGNVGIGTNDPGTKLEVKGTGSTLAKFVASGSTEDALVRIIGGNYATEVDARLFLGENDVLGMTFEYDGLANIGYIGMNDSVDPTGSYSRRIQMPRAGSDVNFLAGNVGIGNGSPDQKLTIGVDNSGSNVGYIRLRGHNALESNIYKTASYGIHMDTDSNSQGIRIDGGKQILGMTGNVGIGTESPSSLLNLYQAAASPVMMTLHNYQADISGGGFNQGNFIDFKMTDDNATFTPQARIGMVIGDSDGGDSGIISEGSGNFQIYTGNGTDAVGNGNLDLHSRFGQNGRLKIFTPGNTFDGTYYSTVTIDNTGTSTWSRLRFDRSGEARWGLALGTDDKFRISNLYTNGTTASADDNCLVIDNNSDVGIGTGAPAAKLHVYGEAWFQSDSGMKVLSATSNPTLGANIYFSDEVPGQSQIGFIRYKHADSSVVSGSNEQMIFGGDQPVSDFLFEGDVHSTGDVVAYFSDPRLKDFHGNITGALDKVNSLGGYYFTENELAKEIGYRNDRMQVGVNAEEVEAVLPEVVTTALVNENISQDKVRDYKTVKYEKMVPLLIEAIKELTEQNMEMKQRLDKLEGEA